jgi:hypothetical protein
MGSLERTADEAVDARKPLFAISSAHAGINAAQIEMLHHFDPAELHQSFIINGP